MPGEPAAAPLAGRGVLVTRPMHQAAHLCALIEARGGVALRFPLLTITPVTEPAVAARRLREAAGATLAVFVSANAVREAVALVPDLAARLAGVRLAALGGGTATALAEAGFTAPVTTPRGITTEALLEREEFAPDRVDCKRVIIIKGVGGRDRLASSLRARGARVETVDVYRRSGPTSSLADFLAVAPVPVAVAIVTSGEAVEHLERVAVGPASRAYAWPLVLPSDRVARGARERGFRGPVRVASEMRDEALVDAAACLIALAGAAGRERA